MIGGIIFLFLGIVMFMVYLGLPSFLGDSDIYSPMFLLLPFICFTVGIGLLIRK